ncbi:hypothetical protein [Frigoriglobus tundricola]|uniref:Lipoprotein n=1 Tax=Frigoriglobus tundricola TaxID=2774151 RepID=A0A6M5Z314_9BACT|nr:hypothetical protein [Frigoriglobus tundricola]QJX00808.1 hypothetical protein FTUN_8446 [Frigoriglobus tundricola]
MIDPKLTRRQLTRLALAALGGLAAGCGKNAKPNPEGGGAGTGQDAHTADKAAHSILSDPHICRGINTCKNKGKTGTSNECAGQGHCATAAAHDCNGQNACRGQGGCGEHPGENECKGKGACEVPLSDKTWPKARKKFEEVMTAAGKKFGAAPAKKG